MVAYKRGAVFNNEEMFSYKPFEEAFMVAEINTNEYLRKKERKEALPWDLVDVLISKS